MPKKLGILILYILMYSIYLTFLAIVHTISIIIYLTMSVKKQWMIETLVCSEIKIKATYPNPNTATN